MEAQALIGDGLAFGDLLRRLRVEAGLSQEALAERAGLSLRGLSDLERGARRAPYRDTVLRLAEALRLGEAERAALLTAAPRARAAARPGAPAARSPMRRLALPVTSFLGREAELEQVSRLVQSERLVTLVGPGGVGKTRLAQEVVRRLPASGAPEVAWVDLTPTRDPRLVLTLVTEALDVRDLGGRGLHQALAGALAHRQVLLLLDNVEHVLEAAGEVAALLRACPGLTVLATSREPLRVHGERIYSVPPLGLPGEADLPRPERVARAPAVALFVERAQAANLSFRLDAASSGAVVELCRRLDGLPLAIELAAARSHALAPGILLERDGRLDLLRGLRDQPARHASLRTVLDWSYQLLSQPEQVLLRRLAVFAGGCTPEAAEAVCGPGLPPESVLDLLGRLVDRSLLVVEPGPAGGRFRLLETVREYAAEQLQASGECEALRRQHAVWFLGLAERAAPHIWGPDTTTWVDGLEREHDNLRAALGWSVETAGSPPDAEGQATPAEVGLRLGAALMLFWDVRASADAGRGYCPSAGLRLVRTDGVPAGGVDREAWRRKPLCVGTIPGYRTGAWWKASIASAFYLFVLALIALDFAGGGCCLAPGMPPP